MTAFSRRADALRDVVERVGVVYGDGRDAQSVRRAVRGADAVIAIIGSGSRTGPHQVAEVARMLIRAMDEEGVRRLVITSAYPLVGDRPRLAMALLRRIFAAVYADAAEMERAVSASSLDWTIARLNRLTDTPATGQARMTPDLFEHPAAISRADAARVLLDITEDPRLASTAVNIARPTRKGGNDTYQGI